MGWRLRGFPLASRPRCSAGAAPRAVPWLPLASWRRPGTVPPQGHAWTLGTDGLFAALSAAPLPGVPHHHVSHLLAGSTEHSWRSSSCQASPWECPKEGPACAPAVALRCSLLKRAVGVSPALACPCARHW